MQPQTGTCPLSSTCTRTGALGARTCAFPPPNTNTGTVCSTRWITSARRGTTTPGGTRSSFDEMSPLDRRLACITNTTSNQPVSLPSYNNNDNDTFDRLSLRASLRELLPKRRPAPGQQKHPHAVRHEPARVKLRQRHPQRRRAHPELTHAERQRPVMNKTRLHSNRPYGNMKKRLTNTKAPRWARNKTT